MPPNNNRNRFQTSNSLKNFHHFIKKKMDKKKEKNYLLLLKFPETLISMIIKNYQIKRNPYKGFVMYWIPIIYHHNLIIINIRLRLDFCVVLIPLQKENKQQINFYNYCDYNFSCFFFFCNDLLPYL